MQAKELIRRVSEMPLPLCDANGVVLWDVEFEKETKLIDDGILDSFDIVSLVSILEETYKIKIDGLDIVPENFSSIKGIAELVKKSGGNF